MILTTLLFLIFGNRLSLSSSVGMGGMNLKLTGYHVRIKFKLYFFLRKMLKRFILNTSYQESTIRYFVSSSRWQLFKCWVYRSHFRLALSTTKFYVSYFCVCRTFFINITQEYIHQWNLFLSIILIPVVDKAEIKRIGIIEAATNKILNKVWNYDKID